MKFETYSLEELDQPTRDYLRAIRASRGQGMPGVYFKQSNPLPWIGLILGIIIVIAFFAFTVPPYESPIRITFLRTAGMLLGGWMIVAALRVWIGGMRGKNLGHFLYADITQYFDVKGTSVSHLPLSPMTTFEGRDNYGSDEAYQSTTFDIFYGDEKTTITMNNGDQATTFNAFLLMLLENRDRPDWQGFTPAQKSRSIRNAVLNEQGDSSEMTIPTPSRSNPPAFGWLNLIVVTAIGCFFFFTMLPAVIAERDDFLVEHSLTLPKDQAPDFWRMYLLDPHTSNRKNREKVERLLYESYAPKLAEVKALAPKEEPGKTLNEGWEQILDRTAKSVQPVVTLRVSEEVKGPAEGDLNPDQGKLRVDLLRKRLADGLTAFVGHHMLDIAEIPADLPAMIDVHTTLERQANGKTKIAWKVEMRPNLDQDPVSASWEDIAEPGQIEAAIAGGRDKLLAAWVGAGKPAFALPAPPPE